MNNRILELAKTAKEYSERVPYYRGIQNGKTWEGKINQVYNSKFAELIVRDAMDYASRNWEHGHLLAQDLKVHFGVE